MCEGRYLTTTASMDGLHYLTVLCACLGRFGGNGTLVAPCGRDSRHVKSVQLHADLENRFRVPLDVANTRTGSMNEDASNAQ